MATPPDHQFKVGDDWQAATGYRYEPGGNTFDLTDTDRWLVEGQLRLRGSDEIIAAVLDFSPEGLAESTLVPRLLRSQTVLLQPGRTYVGDAQVTDLTGPYGRLSTSDFTVKVNQDVTRAGQEPVGLHVEPEAPTEGVDNGDLWIDTSTLPDTPLVYKRIANAWVQLVAI